MLNVESRNGVLFVTINRPEVRNAFNDELIAKLHDTFRDPAPDIRAIVIRGEGPAFCAGGDLQWMAKAANYTEEENREDALKLANMLNALVNCPVPSIALVHGAAFGGGCGLVAASDIAIAVDGTKFAFSEVRLGLVPATISMFVVPKIGQGNARALFSTGEAFDAADALRIGLVHSLVTTPEELKGVLDYKLQAILNAGPRSVAQSKQLALSVPKSLNEAAQVLAEARSGDEGKEGVAAFLEKRKASFTAKWEGYE